MARDRVLFYPGSDTGRKRAGGGISVPPYEEASSVPQAAPMSFPPEYRRTTGAPRI